MPTFFDLLISLPHMPLPLLGGGGTSENGVMVAGQTAKGKASLGLRDRYSKESKAKAIGQFSGLSFDHALFTC